MYIILHSYPLKGGHYIISYIGFLLNSALRVSVGGLLASKAREREKQRTKERRLRVHSQESQSEEFLDGL